VTAGYCTREQLGRFIIDLPAGKSVNDTSIWSARVELSANQSQPINTEKLKASGLWDNPEGNPTPPISKYDSPWRRASGKSFYRQITPIEPSGVVAYKEPIHYPVKKTGYYCVGGK